MATLHGPLFSADAKGTIAGLLTLTHYKGRVTIKRKSPGPGTNTPAQRSAAVMLGLLTKLWEGPILEPNDRLAWAALAAEKNLPPKNAYLSTNLSRWSAQEFPSVQPGPRTGLGNPTFAFLVLFTGGKGIVTCQYNLTALNGGWWIGAYVDRSSLTPLPTNRLAKAEQLTTTGVHRFQITNLPPGAYVGKLHWSNYNGANAIIGTQKAFTVT